MYFITLSFRSGSVDGLYICFNFRTICCVNYYVVCFYFRKKTLGRTFTTSIGFVIAVLSLSLLKLSFITIYIPIFTLALPLVIYLFLQNRLTSAQSMIISASVAVLFGLLMFVIPFNIIWDLVVGATVILAISQFSRKYRFI